MDLGKLVFKRNEMPDWFQYVTAGALAIIAIELGAIASTLGEIKDQLKDIEINTREINAPSSSDDL